MSENTHQETDLFFVSEGENEKKRTERREELECWLTDLRQTGPCRPRRAETLPDDFQEKTPLYHGEHPHPKTQDAAASRARSLQPDLHSFLVEEEKERVTVDGRQL